MTRLLMVRPGRPVDHFEISSLNGTERICTEGHEGHEEITPDGLPADVPGCEVTSEAFGRLKCVFLKWKLILRPGCFWQVFALFVLLRCNFDQFREDFHAASLVSCSTSA